MACAATMMSRSKYYVAGLAIIVAAGLVVTGIIGGSAGPLQALTAGGQPQFAVAWGVEHRGDSANMCAYVFNQAQGPVKLISASLVPISGHPTGRLVHLAVGAHHDCVAATRGWPPGVPVIRFKNALLPHGQSNIIFGFEGAAAGRNYMTAGLRIVYRYEGQSRRMTAWSSAVACVVTAAQFNNASGRRCAHVSDTVTRPATEKLAGV